jgi:alpha-galactosidase/6-phospho-beta-glucosidase family protein
MNEPSDKGSNPRIVIVGGGSRQWTPKLLLDIARTESLSHAHVVLHDINPSRLPLLAEQLRRVVTSQELTVKAAMEPDQRRVVDALLTDPLAGRIDWRDIFSMAQEMLDATAPWLPSFSS